MEDSNVAIILGLLLASLPLVIIALAAIAVGAVFAALASIHEIMRTFLLPFRYWFLRFCLVIDGIFLLPIFLIVMLVSDHPDFNLKSVLIFLGLALSPTIVSWTYCKWVELRTGFDPDEIQLK